MSIKKLIVGGFTFFLSLGTMAGIYFVQPVVAEGADDGLDALVTQVEESSEAIRLRGRDQLRDASCGEDGVACTGDQLRAQEREQLRDGSCGEDGVACTGDQLRAQEREQLCDGDCEPVQEREQARDGNCGDAPGAGNHGPAYGEPAGPAGREGRRQSR